LLARTADINTIALILTIAAALISWRTRLHPLWMIALGAALGAVGWV
jgi:chromate transporter